MKEDDIPQNVRAFVVDHVDSVVLVEILLLLQGEPARARDAAEVGNVLKIEPAWAQSQLDNLRARGLLKLSDDGRRFSYAPQTPQLDAAVAGLAKAYADRRVTVIGLIYSKPPPADPVRSFADAFRLRKDPDRG